MKRRTGVWRIAAGTALGVGSLGQVAAQSSGFVEQALVTAKALGIKMQVVLVSQRGEFEAAADSMGARAGASGDRAATLCHQPARSAGRAAGAVQVALCVRRTTVCDRGWLDELRIQPGGRVTPRRKFCGTHTEGAKPESLPVEEPTIYELALNLKTARALGIPISQSLRLRANDVVQ